MCEITAPKLKSWGSGFCGWDQIENTVQDYDIFTAVWYYASMCKRNSDLLLKVSEYWKQIFICTKKWIKKNCISALA